MRLSPTTSSPTAIRRATWSGPRPNRLFSAGGCGNIPAVAQQLLSQSRMAPQALAVGNAGKRQILGIAEVGLD
jgi:hypothetical protein